MVVCDKKNIAEDDEEIRIDILVMLVRDVCQGGHTD